MSMCKSEKPIPRVSLPDWHSRLTDVCRLVSNGTDEGRRLRNEGRRLRNEVDTTANWNNYYNNDKLSDHITVTRRVLQLLEYAERKSKQEIFDLKQEQSITERECESYNKAVDIVTDCLRVRDRKSNHDLCYDDPDTQLKKELELIDKIKRNFVQKCTNSWEQITKLEAALFKVTLDISEKKDALVLEVDTLALDKHCSSTCHKFDVLRVPRDLVPYDSWEETSKKNIDESDSEVSKSAKLREELYMARLTSANEYRAQADMTDYVLRIRVYEANKVKNELEWQKNKVTKEMERLKKEIDLCEKQRRNNIDMLKCAETRIENRNFRPIPEMVRDEPLAGLLDEVVELRQEIKLVEDKRDELKGAHNHMEDLLFRIEQDLEKKNLCLTLDNQCLDIRKEIYKNNSENGGQFDRNILLTKLDKEVHRE